MGLKTLKMAHSINEGQFSRKRGKPKKRRQRPGAQKYPFDTQAFREDVLQTQKSVPDKKAAMDLIVLTIIMAKESLRVPNLE